MTPLSFSSSPMKNDKDDPNHSNSVDDEAAPMIPETTAQEGTSPTPTAPNQKVHHATVCMIPPPEQAPHVWKVVAQMRRQLKDPGFFRWPPHANLLYPFCNITPYDDNSASHKKLDEIVEQLHSATRQIEPFRVRLETLGTFGGKQRGVLWLRPDSFPWEDEKKEEEDGKSVAPLVVLHQRLEEAFPMCLDQTKQGSFTPHMTLSHFETLDDALAAKTILERDYNNDLKQCLEFCLDRIYLLHRQGDNGQFLRVAELGLGSNSQCKTFQPPCPFIEMPTTEEAWVYEERMKMKARRNNNGRRGRRRGGRRQQERQQRRTPRVSDTPEEIAAKRAARKAKRERLEREQQEKEQQQWEL